MQGRATRARPREVLVLDHQQNSRSELQRMIELLLDRIRLAVIFGGNKSTPGSVIYQSQNTRSWKSYEAVAEDIAASLRRCGFRNVELIPEDMSMPERIRGANIHMAWLNTGGVQGYNSTSHAPAMLEMLVFLMSATIR